jgi:hypothetical protein
MAKAARPRPRSSVCRLAVGQRGAHHFYQLGPKRPAVFRDLLALRRRRLGHVRQRLFEHRRRMRVAGDDGHRAEAQLELVGKLLQNRLDEGVAHLAVVERYENKSLAR